MELINGKVPHILIIDDVDPDANPIEDMVRDLGYMVGLASSAQEALESFETSVPNLILWNMGANNLEGFQLCEMLKSYPGTRKIPIIFMSALKHRENRKKAYELGGNGFIERPADLKEMELTIDMNLRVYALQERLEEENRRMNQIISTQAYRFEQEQKRLLRIISKIAEEDNVGVMTEHLENVSHNARLLAQALNFTDRYENQISDIFTEGVEIAAYVHDIGKIMIPREVIRKPGALTEEERELVNTHTTEGYNILKEAYIDFEGNYIIQISADVIKYHHENWDGTGYPEGISGEDIPLSARIIRIVDTYDSLLRNHRYRKGFSRERALEIIQEGKGVKFDPYIVDVFFMIEKQLKKY